MISFFNYIDTFNISINTDEVKAGLICRCRVKGTSLFRRLKPTAMKTDGNEKKTAMKTDGNEKGRPTGSPPYYLPQKFLVSLIPMQSVPSLALPM